MFLIYYTFHGTEEKKIYREKKVLLHNSTRDMQSRAKVGGACTASSNRSNKTSFFLCSWKNFFFFCMFSKKKNEEKSSHKKIVLFEKLQHIMYSTGAWQNVIRKENRFYSKTIEEQKKKLKCTKIKLSGVVAAACAVCCFVLWKCIVKALTPNAYTA